MTHGQFNIVGIIHISKNKNHVIPTSKVKIASDYSDLPTTLKKKKKFNQTNHDRQRFTNVVKKYE